MNTVIIHKHGIAHDTEIIGTVEKICNVVEISDQIYCLEIPSSSCPSVKWGNNGWQRLAEAINKNKSITSIFLYP